jgi:pyruvate dehydrogenase kinase 2/3/4
VLIGHHNALYEQLMNGTKAASRDDGDWVGILCKRTNVLQVIKNAVNDAIFVFENKYGPFTAPQVTFHTTEKRPELRYVPSHLHHILFELTKNSLRATFETHSNTANNDNSSKLPPIKIVISEGSEDITVKVSDEGGGIPRSAESLIWSFGYTTAALGSDEKMPLAGFGYGLPLSRLYARYFGGDLKIISMDGFGTDAYLNLCRLSDSKEPIIQ